MKKALVVILSLLMLVGIFPDTYDYFFFKMNQVDISETLCVQKDKKGNTCQGKCFLKKMMSENDDQNIPYAPTEKENKNNNFYCLEIDGLAIPQPKIVARKKSNFKTNQLIDRLSTNRLLRPPDYSFDI